MALPGLVRPIGMYFYVNNRSKEKAVISVIQFNLYLGIAVKIISRMKMNASNTDLESIKGN